MLVYGLLIALLLIVVANLAVAGLEQLGLISTFRGPDDFAQHLDEAVYERDPRGGGPTSDYGLQPMDPSRVGGTDGEVFRAFVLGGSFAMGTPYSVQNHARELPGGIASWLRADLEAMLVPLDVEVVNAAAGNQDSHRVRRVAAEVLAYEPDLLIVATCNNEGLHAPPASASLLRRFPLFRLIVKLAAPPDSSQERTAHTEQQSTPDEIRRYFRTNLEAIIAGAAARHVPVVLCTLPVHLAMDRNAEEGELTADELYERVERHPANRCRPSLNAIVRELAESHDHVFLADLEQRAVEQSATGVPGSELFVDSCHMNWSGYAGAASAILETVMRHRLIPEPAHEPPARQETARRFRLHQPASPYPRPTGRLESAMAVGSGELHVTGWVMADRHLYGAAIRVDGGTDEVVELDQVRDDVCARLPDSWLCEQRGGRVGFDQRIPLPDGSTGRQLELLADDAVWVMVPVDTFELGAP